MKKVVLKREGIGQSPKSKDVLNMSDRWRIRGYILFTELLLCFTHIDHRVLSNFSPRVNDKVVIRIGRFPFYS